MSRLNYQIQFAWGEDCTWLQGPRGTFDYCQGYLDAKCEEAPRLAMRIINLTTGRVLRTKPAKLELNIGQIAGFPTAEQYEVAADEALKKARLIRQRSLEHDRYPAEPAPVQAPR